MRRPKLLIISSLCLIPIIAGIVLLDLAGTFSFSDIPFGLAFLIFSVFMLIQKGISRVSFVSSLYFLIAMGLSYVQTGSSIITERLGEWFYLFFLVGILQYIKELWTESKSTTGEQAPSSWDDYYMNRVQSNKRISAGTQLDLHARWYRNWLSYIEKHIPIFDSSLSSFEIGSGMGGVLTLLSSFGVPIRGSDISKKAMGAFAHKYPIIPYIVYNIEKTLPGEHKYDRVFAFEVLEHLKRPYGAIKNIKKMVKTGGYFIGTTPYPYPHVTTMPTHYSVHPPLYWEKQFKKAGFSCVHTYPMSLPPYLWRIHPKLNLVFPWFVPFRYWISTILIIAKI